MFWVVRFELKFYPPPIKNSNAKIAMILFKLKVFIFKLLNCYIFLVIYT